MEKKLYDGRGWVEKMQMHIKKLEEIGNLMSNVFFNWKQSDRFTPSEREMMNALQEKWDSIPK